MQRCRPSFRYEYCNVASNGTYWCGCRFGKNGGVPCKPGTVRYLVGDRLLSGGGHAPGKPSNATPTPNSRIKFWDSNVRQRLTGFGVPGHWYSTPAAGECGVGANCTDSLVFLPCILKLYYFWVGEKNTRTHAHTRTQNRPPASPLNAWVNSSHLLIGTWRMVAPIKKVWKNCSDAVVNKYVELKSPTCFNACAENTTTGVLNRTSPCYVGCFFDAVLGPHSDTTYNGTGGLSADELVALWDAPFASDSVCPNLL
jgi:hypothetical protein